MYKEGFPTSDTVKQWIDNPNMISQVCWMTLKKIIHVQQYITSCDGKIEDQLPEYRWVTVSLQNIKVKISGELAYNFE